jgi:hypothetical protein
MFPNDLSGQLFIPSHLRVLHVSFEPIFLRMSLFDNLVFGANIEGDKKRGRIVNILERLSLHDYVPLLDDEVYWMSRMTPQARSSMNLARAIIANPHALFLHKPAVNSSKVSGQIIMCLLREYVEHRGVEQDVLQPVSARRPRTVLYTSIQASSCKHANIIYRVGYGSVTQLDHKDLTDDLFS